MDILVGIHVGGDYNPGINAAKISLNKTFINHIHTLAKRARHRQIIHEFCNLPDLGKSDLDLENDHYKDIEKLRGKESQQAVFIAEGRSEIVQLCVDRTDFWWEGVFKHTDVSWETRMIPLSFLPQPKPVAKKVQYGSLPDVDMTAEQMNAIHEKIASGISHGLNAREIDRAFNRHVTKAQLIRLLMEHIERNH